VTWLRPRIYDRAAGGSEADPELDELLPTEMQAALLASSPAGAGPDEPWCARCASLYQPAIHTCPDCKVPLQRAPAVTQPPVPAR
jgi:hypothetical protein